MTGGEQVERTPKRLRGQAPTLNVLLGGGCAGWTTGPDPMNALTGGGQWPPSNFPRGRARAQERRQAAGPGR
jgi:hypothetical protein